MILKLSTCNRRSLLCTCARRAWSLNVFQFFVALLNNFSTSSNSLKNVMNVEENRAGRYIELVDWKWPTSKGKL